MSLRWGRYGHTARSAHLFDGEKQMCDTRRGDSRGLFNDKPELTVHGVPYGNVCARCLKLFKRQEKV